MEEYKEAIDLLLQVRRPKLSNDFKPTMLNEVLNQSLQPLSEDDLRPMSEAITNMDDIKDQLDSLKVNIEAAQAIAKEYNAHCYYALYKKYDLYENEEKKFQKQTKDLKVKKERIEEVHKEKLHDQALDENFAIKKQLLDEERAGLVDGDVLAKQKSLDHLQSEVTTTIEEIKKKETKHQILEDRLVDKCNDEHRFNQRADEIYSYLNDTIKELDNISNTMDFTEHESMKYNVYIDIKREYDFTYSKEQLLELIEKVQKGKFLFYQFDAFQSQKISLEDAFEKAKDKKQEAELTLGGVQQTYQETLASYKETYITWSYGNKYLKWTDTQQQDVLKILLQYEEHQDYGKINQLIDEWYKELNNKENLHLMYMKEQLRISKEQMDNQEHEIEIVKSQKELTPKLAKQAQENRKQLLAQNIPFKPFYTLIEFEKNLDDASKNRYEMLFKKTQMLNALVVEENYREELLNKKMKIDDYLFVNQSLSNIQTYELHKNTTRDELQNHFRFNDTTLFSWNDDYVKFGHVTTKLTDEMQAIYIGVEARERHRQQTLDLLQHEYEEYKQNVKVIEQEMESIQKTIVTIDKEYHAFPKEERLKESYKKLKDCMDVLKLVTHALELQRESLKQLEQQMKPVLLEIAQIAEKLNIDNKKSDFDNLEDNLKEYQFHLQRFSEYHQKYVSACEHYKQIKEQVEDLQVQLDEVQGDLQSKRRLKTKQEGQIAILSDQLEQMGMKEIQTRLNQISERIKNIELAQIELNKNFGRHETEMQTLINEIEISEQELINQEKQRNNYKNLLYEEIKLGYINFDENDSLRKQLLANKKETHDALMKQGMNLQKFNEVFMARQGLLTDYNLTYRTLEVADTFDDAPVRLYVFAKYAGKQLSFFELLDVLQADIIEQEQILKDSDRQLFEDILINTISSKVKHKIHQSRQWVEKMNSYMSAMNTSSSLKLQLIWKQKKAEDDNQLNVSELVDLLERDATVLKESDLNRISKHFRSKINQARLLSTSEGNLNSFHQIMKEIMDYRTWFDFTIIYDKEQAVRKELTNNKFSTFSGGEKAISMYIPLFSAVAAKFSNGYKYAPSIIALDEAFAGVDDRNIGEMFELIEKFGFDYIMNSQSLWGDYPSVRSLSIYELHRPSDGRFVSILHYYWNGHVKEYIVGDIQ